MPVADLVLADVPAQQHVLFTEPGRKVDESLVEVLHLHAEVGDRLDAAGNLERLVSSPVVELLHLLRRQIAAVSGDLDLDGFDPGRRLRQRTPRLDHPLGDRPYLGQRLVRLLDCEDPLAQVRIIVHSVSAPQRVRVRRRPARRELRLEWARNPVPELFLWTRAAIWAVALLAFAAFEPNHHPRVARWDDPSVTRDLGWVTDVWARWDSVFFLRIAEHGYDAASGAAAAFYPVYPLAVGGLGRVFFGHYVLAGIAVSLLASLGAFLLLHRLAEERLGAEGARRAVLYLALAPMAAFLQAVYSEALYLLLTLAAFALAERRRWLPAGVLAGVAVLTRVAGIALLPALVLLAWRSPDRRRALASLAAAPVLFAAYPLYLWQRLGDPWAFAHAQDQWHRHLSPAGPLGGIWHGLRAAWAGVEQLASGSHTHAYWPAVSVADSDPFHVAAVNLQNFAFLVLFAALTVVAWRRFGAPYGLFCALSLAVPLSVPSSRWPLLSIPRFGLVLFPLFLALAALAGNRPRLHTAVLAVSALLLGVTTVQWALWQWVS